MSDTFSVNNGYISLPVTVDPNTLIQQAIAAIQDDLPGWIPVEGHIEMLLLEQFAAMAAQAANVAASASEAIFEYYGTQLIGITPIAGAPASALTTWTFTDTQGYTVPPGVVVGYQVSATNISLFSTVEEFSTIAGSPLRTIAAAEVASGLPELLDPAGSFTPSDVNKTVTGTSIPGGTTILSVQTSTQATMSQNATANEAGEEVTLGAIAGTSQAFNIPIQSQSIGTINNNLAIGQLTLVNPAYSFVTSIESTTVSSGGSNAETVPQYLNRLSNELELLTPRPILPSDYAALAQSVPGVDRAAAYNNTYAGTTFLGSFEVGDSLLTAGPDTTVSLASNNVNLPTPIINVISTTNFTPSGSFVVETTDGFSTVSYTGVTSTSFTGCTGGAGEIVGSNTPGLGSLISSSTFTFSTFDVGLTITGTGIPSNTTLIEVSNPYQVVLSNLPTSSESFETLTLVAVPYDPPSEAGIERAVAVSCVDVNGQPVGTSIANQVIAKLSSLREVNFMVSYLQPTYQDIYVTYTVIAQPGANANALTADINAAVTSFLSPAVWAGGLQTPPTWDTSIDNVYYLSLAGVIENVPGVQSIQVVGGIPSLGMGTASNPTLGSGDVSLASSPGVDLPNLVSISGAVLPGS